MRRHAADGGLFPLTTMRTLTSLAAAVLLTTTAVLQAADWSGQIAVAQWQVGRLVMLDAEGNKGVCSAVVINKRAGYAVTASHCFHEPTSELSITFNGRHAALTRLNRLLDLAVVRVDLKGEQQITLAEKVPPTGSEVAVLGHAFGVEEFVAQFGHVSQPYQRDTERLWMNVETIGGDSGGAVINTKGELVGITTSIFYNGPSAMGAAVPVNTVREFVEPYLPKVAP